jgi:hypothetical protein
MNKMNENPLYARPSDDSQQSVTNHNSQITNRFRPQNSALSRVRRKVVVNHVESKNEDDDDESKKEDDDDSASDTTAKSNGASGNANDEDFTYGNLGDEIQHGEFEDDHSFVGVDETQHSDLKLAKETYTKTLEHLTQLKNDTNKDVIEQIIQNYTAIYKGIAQIAKQQPILHSEPDEHDSASNESLTDPLDSHSENDESLTAPLVSHSESVESPTAPLVNSDLDVTRSESTPSSLGTPGAPTSKPGASLDSESDASTPSLLDRASTGAPTTKSQSGVVNSAYKGLWNLRNSLVGNHEAVSKKSIFNLSNNSSKVEPVTDSATNPATNPAPGPTHGPAKIGADPLKTSGGGTGDKVIHQLTFDEISQKLQELDGTTTLEILTNLSQELSEVEDNEGSMYFMLIMLNLNDSDNTIEGNNIKLEDIINTLNSFFTKYKILNAINTPIERSIRLLEKYQENRENVDAKKFITDDLIKQLNLIIDKNDKHKNYNQGTQPKKKPLIKEDDVEKITVFLNGITRNKEAFLNEDRIINEFIEVLKKILKYLHADIESMQNKIHKLQNYLSYILKKAKSVSEKVGENKKLVEDLNTEVDGVERVEEVSGGKKKRKTKTRKTRKTRKIRKTKKTKKTKKTRKTKKTKKTRKTKKIKK